MKIKASKNIGIFKHYTKKPNTIAKGNLYIAKIYDESKKRPDYIVAQKVNID